MSQWLEQVTDFSGSPRTMRVVGILLAVLLLSLAALQYHWIGQLTEAKKSEMEQALRASAGRFTADFNRELSRLYSSLLSGRPWTPSPDSGTAFNRYADRYRVWVPTTTHSKVLKNLFLVADKDLFRLDTEVLEFEQVPWPADWSGLHDDLKRLSDRSRGLRPSPGAGQPPQPRPFSGAFEKLPILASMRFDRDPDGEPRPAGWVIAELDMDYIGAEFIPELSQRHFSGNYQILITNRAESPAAIFSRGDGQAFGTPDYEGGIFEIQPTDFGRGRGGGSRGPGGPPRRDGKNGGGGPPVGPGGGGGGGGGPMFGFGGGPGGRWILQVKHTAGSLDRAVQTLRYRNLGISFAILLLMCLTVGMFFESTRRARQLALQQMEFVASISHELRTPLTVICSAGDNLAGGVVKNDTQVKRYGNLIRSEGRRLADMVEQILGYAGIQKGRMPAPRPVEVETIVESALKACSQLLDAKGCTVETDIAPDLPAIAGDAASLSHSVQNLINNAAKYGGDWVRVEAKLAPGDKRIAITVEDRGPGIEAKDLRHIFEPFYRGRKAVDDQIHGTGLGLSLVKRIVEAHSGRVSVESTPGSGTRFTLELPVMTARAEADQPAAQAMERTNKNNEATSTLG